MLDSFLILHAFPQIRKNKRGFEKEVFVIRNRLENCYKKVSIRKQNDSLTIHRYFFVVMVELLIKSNFITKKRNWKVKNENKKRIRYNKMYSNYRMFLFEKLEL
ncbi:hypothetical protein LBK6_04245 [Leptospira borgpetersenii serovar Hardjo]|nr:hypothetical protein LBK6_04245 [Leptospira borgpetersenii serovar Hardjo]AWV69490.1 hypothetical protein B9T54_04625 [Leptospira borgpetersenii serovar Hardjo-bovis]TQE57734.1 hypothetical protein FFZ96_05975 [Leptospira borgpetersenii]AMX60835.1 hypothetical protein LBK9_04200 [Leptospira borgpetersenii serovar Hardjo]AMX64080.1 hypothetical protein LBK30_04245 [Leptospira borgpetersenii serovar Hardjo]